MAAARKKGPSTPLTRERIVQTALDLVDREGLDALTMRRLGTELGVDPMAVYYHVADKEALLDALVEAVMAGIDLSCPLPDGPAEERLLVTARIYRDAMLAHVHALPVVLARSPRTPAALRPVDFMLGEFMDAGLEPEQAVIAMNTLAAAVRGYAGMTASDVSEAEPVDIEALQALMTAEEFPALHAAAHVVPQDPDAMFDVGVRALVRGFVGEGASGDTEIDSSRGTGPRPHHMKGR